jgi:hypothetical protein
MNALRRRMQRHIVEVLLQQSRNRRSMQVINSNFKCKAQLGYYSDKKGSCEPILGVRSEVAC